MPTTIPVHNNRSKGELAGIPTKYRNGHWKKAHAKKLEERYEVDLATGCWLWLGEKLRGKKPYGRMKLPTGGRQVAHRWVYEQVVGPIPDGLQLDHLCRNHSCVNPDHLEPVTPAENLRRGRGTKLTPEIVRQIRTTPGINGREWGERLGMGKDAINGIRRGDSWKDIDPPKMEGR